MSASHARITGDQAVALRQLVRDARAAEGTPFNGDAPPRSEVIVVAGAKGGVGATTLSLRLAEALADRGPTLLVDANLRQADLAHVAAAADDGRRDLADVLAGVCRAEDALVSLREDLSLLPGAWAPAAQPDATVEAVGRWLDELEQLAAQGNTIVLDVGVGMKPWTESLWRRATTVCLVATPDKLAVLGAYAAIKLARGEGVSTPISLLVNRVGDAEGAERIHDRIEETCLRFLGEPLGTLGWAPHDPEVAAQQSLSTGLSVASEWVRALEFRPTACGVD